MIDTRNNEKIKISIFQQLAIVLDEQQVCSTNKLKNNIFVISDHDAHTYFVFLINRWIVANAIFQLAGKAGIRLIRCFAKYLSARIPNHREPSFANVSIFPSLHRE